MRQEIASRVFFSLKKAGFEVSTFLQCNSCYDFAAKKGKEIFLVKILENIDSIRQEQATELKRLATAFNAKAIIVGLKTKVFFLKEKVAYERYCIPALSPASFSLLLDSRLPESRFFKGKEIVSLDTEKLRQKRQELGLSLSMLAEKADLSTQAIYRLEESAKSTIQNAKKLEEALGGKLTVGQEIFQQSKDEKIFDEKLSDDSFESLQRIGLKLAVFQHAPFRAYSRLEDALLIDKGYSKQELKKKAINLENARGITKGHSMIISKETKYPSIGQTPIIQEEELESLSKAKDLLELIKEREKKEKH